MQFQKIIVYKIPPGGGGGGGSIASSRPNKYLEHSAFRTSLSYHLSLRSSFFSSGRFTQVFTVNTKFRDGVI